MRNRDGGGRGRERVMNRETRMERRLGKTKIETKRDAQGRSSLEQEPQLCSSIQHPQSDAPPLSGDS